MQQIIWLNNILFVCSLLVGPIPRLNNTNYVPNTNRIQRVQQIDSMPYNNTTNKSHVNNSNNMGDHQDKDVHKHKNLRSPNKSLSKLSNKLGIGNNANSKSKPSLSKGSNSKNERNSSRSTSSSSSSKKSKNRKDDKSPRKCHDAVFHFNNFISSVPLNDQTILIGVDHFNFSQRMANHSSRNPT